MLGPQEKGGFSPSRNIQTINIAPFLADPESPAASEVIASVRSACLTTGFFQVTGHGLPERLQRSLLQALRDFFTLDCAEKLKMDNRTTVGYRGYDPFMSQSYHAGDLPDLKESFFVGHELSSDDPAVQEGRFFIGPNVWPDEAVLPSARFRLPVEAYFKAIHSLALKMLGLLARTLPYGTGIFDEFTTGHTIAILRMLHYPPAPPQESLGGKRQFGAEAHTDCGAITLLLQDENSGLEVLDPATREFVDIKPTPNAFVFNVGDMLSVWTGGEYKSSVHRVINKASTNRYSAAFFYDGALDCPLTPLNGCGVTGEAALTVEKHLIRRFTESYSNSSEQKAE